MCQLDFVEFGFCENRIKYFKELIGLSKLYEKSLAMNQYLLESINIANAAGILQIIICYKLKGKKSKVIEFIGDNFSAVLKSDECCEVNQQTVAEILKIERVCEEFTGKMEVFNAVLRYIEKNHQDYNTQAVEDIRLQLKDVFDLIRFPTMSCSEFLECLKFNSAFLNFNEISNIIKIIKDKLSIDQSIKFNCIRRTAEQRTIGKPTLKFACYLEHELNIYNRFPDTRKTVFAVNQRTVIMMVACTRGNEKRVNIKVYLKGRHGQIIATGFTNDCECLNDDPILTSCVIPLYPLVALSRV